MMIINLFIICIIVVLTTTTLGFNIINNNNRINRSYRMSINMNTNANADPLLLRAARGINNILLFVFLVTIANTNNITNR